MIQVSSNLTLFLKIFIPTFYLVFFGAFVGTIWFAGYDNFGKIDGDILRWASLFCYLAVTTIFLFTTMKLKRVEMDGQHLFVTNYFKHFRYSYDSIESIKEKEYPFVKIIQIRFKQTGSFGKKVSFLPSKSRFKAFLVSYPEVVQQFLKMDK